MKILICKRLITVYFLKVLVLKLIAVTQTVNTSQSDSCTPTIQFFISNRELCIDDILLNLEQIPSFYLFEHGH